MEKTATLNLRVNPTVKERAEKVLSQLGVPMSTAIDMYLNQISLTGGIPFSVSLPKAPLSIHADDMTTEEIHQKLEKGYNLFNEGEDKANIYTHNAGLKKRLATFAKKYTDLCRLEKSNVQGGVSYVLTKSRLSIRFLPTYSEERRQKTSEYAKKHGLNSQQE